MHVQRQIDELLALRASQWLQLLPTATEADRKAFAEWLGESRLHIQAFLEVSEVEFRLHGTDALSELDVESMLKRLPPPNVTVLAPERGSSESMPPRPTRRRWPQVAGLLAACVSVIAVALFVVSAQGAKYSTEVGEQRTVELADTSIITLNALSKIEVHLEAAQRDIELRHGEAIFTVAHDPERPFLVHTRAGTIRAVGTEFNVYDRPNGDTRVSVLEGRVELTARGSGASGAGSAPELLEAGEEADIRLDGTIRRNEKAAVVNTVAWRQRRLVFDNAGLAEMVAEFNRYNPSLRLRLEGVPADAFRFNGIFDAADPESFVSLLEREPDIAIERHGEEVVVRPRAERE